MNLKPFYQGKVRDLYNVDKEKMLIVSTDRISAFDVIFREIIPNKGILLNQIAVMWFKYLKNKPSNIFSGKTLTEALNFETHFITDELKEFPEPFCNFKEFAHRSMLVYKTKRIDFECVVRGYLAGSGWKEYQQSKSICGISLPDGLTFGSKLPEPIFTPATKEELGKHDVNVSFAYMQEKIGENLANQLRDISIAIYKEASILLEKAGFLLCDTKFEFGIKDNKIYLIDEVLTPDSSRFWKKDSNHFDSYDKQIIRDYLESLNWDKKPPPPELPQNLIQETYKRYEEIYLSLKKVLL
ncbi:MAG: phosphoribosylaminoimidazole-succinocarboxamide synthase [Leptospiraceae bacterium]|nr:MAG: phosphoribosylaminoimidazole-succinocarboxamide synthase [Leptospiraceae bacterium]